MTFILKTRTIDGKLAPVNGEHVEYSDMRGAVRDAEVFAMVLGQEVSVLDVLYGDVVARVGPGGP